MTQSITKRHHFISQMLLRHFTDESGTLFFFSKQFPDKGVLATTPANLFCQTHLYTARDKNGVMDLGLEQQYSELESLASPVIDKIITSVRLGHEPHLTSEERKIWDLFLCNQWKRVPEVGQKVLDQEDAETRIRKFATVFDTNVRKLTPDEVRNLEDLRWLERVKQNAMVSALKRPSPGVLAARTLYRNH